MISSNKQYAALLILYLFLFCFEDKCVQMSDVCVTLFKNPVRLVFAGVKHVILSLFPTLFVGSLGHPDD